ncbi:MAG: PqqD family protein [Methylibium sp.]|nr:PqqD family protein [Methylibium sp.]
MSMAIRREESLMVREIDGELLVLDMRSDQIHQLNRTAAFIWRMCDERATLQAIAAALACEFMVDEETALEDVAKTLSLLQHLHLLVSG